MIFQCSHYFYVVICGVHIRTSPIDPMHERSALFFHPYNLNLHAGSLFDTDILGRYFSRIA